MAELFGSPLRQQVFSANALFFRSVKGSSDIGNVAELWKRCWPVHQYFLSVVRPRVILCLGNGDVSSFSLVRAKCISTPAVGWCGVESSRDGKWFRGELPVPEKASEPTLPEKAGELRCVVVGAPHPSWFPVTDRFKAFLRDLAAGIAKS